VILRLGYLTSDIATGDVIDGLLAIAVLIGLAARRSKWGADSAAALLLAGYVLARSALHSPAH
jgi:hypothetical protein